MTDDPIEKALAELGPASAPADDEILAPKGDELLRTKADKLKDFSVEQKAEGQFANEAGVSSPTYPKDVPEVPERQKVLKADPKDQTAAMFKAFEVQIDDRTVVISDDEFDRFIRAFLHDLPLTLDAEVAVLDGHSDLMFEIDVAPDVFLSQAFHALNQWGEKKLIDEDSNIQWTTHMQALLIWRQVKTIEHRTFEAGYCAQHATQLPASQMREVLKDITILDPIFAMSGPRFRACVTAVVTAEAKYRKLMNGSASRTFSDTAGSE